MTGAGSSEFLAFVQRLTRAINVAIPDDTHALVKIESRTHAAMNAACDLCLAAFKLSEYIDPDHPLFKIALLEDWGEFKDAVLALGA